MYQRGRTNCKRCNVELTDDNCVWMKQYKSPYCQNCNREIKNEWDKANPEKVRDKHFRRKYGISLEQYNELFELQEGKCAICNQESEKPLHVDHDHRTNKVRELICNNCNCALGMVDDNIEILESMISYLYKHG